MNKALVVGDTGICGRHIIQLLLEHRDWAVCGLSRSNGSFEHEHIAADLTDRSALMQALKDHNDITHLFYVGRSPQDDPAAECSINTQMMINVIEALEARCDLLKHIHVMQGMKWYGSHAGAYQTPARESHARFASPNFYFTQQDWLSEREPNATWQWSALRPHQLVGFSDRYPHNIAAVIGLYGSFCQSRDLTFDFPGNVACFESISMVTDAQLLAEAMLFVATTPAAANRAHNVGNGDYFRWKNVWPALADFFHVPCGDVREHSLDDTYGGADNEWRSIVSKHALAEDDMQSIGSWLYGDFSFRAGWDDMAAFTQIYEAGFTQRRDSEAVILNTLQHYRDQKIIP